VTFFRRLARIVVWPRTTMREILDDPRGRMILPLVLLASFSGLIGNANQNARGSLSRVPYAWFIVVAAMLGVMLLTVAFFYLFAWIAYLAGKFLEGRGSHADVRAALAWGLAPLIWALLYRLPATIAGPAVGMGQMRADSEAWRLEPGTGSCLIALVFGLLEFTMFVGYVVVSSRTLAEAHRFSAWRGFGTLLIVGITPIVIIIAAVLSFVHH
jgi:hypothetical protein